MFVCATIVKLRIFIILSSSSVYIFANVTLMYYYSIVSFIEGFIPQVKELQKPD